MALSKRVLRLVANSNSSFRYLNTSLSSPSSLSQRRHYMHPCFLNVNLLPIKQGVHVMSLPIRMQKPRVSPIKLDKEIHSLKAQLEAAKHDVIKYCIDDGRVLPHPEPRTYRPAHSTGEGSLNRFKSSASLVASGVARNVNRVGIYIKESLDDILYPDRKRPK